MSALAEPRRADPAPSNEIVIVRTGTANLASVLAALRRAAPTAAPRFARSPTEVREAAWVILPGVGAFGAAMTALHQQHLVEPLRARIAAGAPLLAICLGLQLFFESSEESPGARGLGVCAGAIRRLHGAVRVPQLGWNAVRGDGNIALADGVAYYANSYCAAAAPPGWAAAYSEYGGRFVAALARGGVLACQFHPELSGPWGLALIRNWLRAGGCPVAQSTARVKDARDAAPPNAEVTSW